MTARTELSALHRQSRPSPRVLAVALLSATVGGLAQLALMASLGYLLAWSAARPTLGVIAGVLAIVELLAFVRAPLRYFDRLRSHAVAFSALRSWRLWLFDRLIPLSPAGLGATRTGDLLSTAMADVEGIGDLYLRVALPLIGSAVPFVAGVVLLGWVNLWSAVAIVIVTSIGLGLLWSTATRGAKLALERARLQGSRAAVLLDAFQGARSLTEAGGWDRPLSAAADLQRRIAVVLRSQQRLVTIRSAIAGVLSALIVMAALYAVTHSTPQLEVRMAIALVTMAIALGELVGGAAGSLGGLDGVLASWKRLQDLAALRPVTREGTEPLPNLPLAVVASDLALSYPLSNRAAFSDMTFELSPQSKTVVTGPSGSGKTSLLIGLLGLWPLAAGELSLNGIALSSLAHEELRRAIGTHLSSSQLFSGTLRSNLEVTGATEQELVAALESVGLQPGEEFLNRTLLDGGRGLSGGEQLRVSAVRALLSGKIAVFLDEPLAQLDEHSAALVMDAIATSTTEQTVVVVAHEHHHFLDYDELRLRSIR